MPSLDLLLDALTLFLLLAYALSALTPLLPLPKGDAPARVAEARRALLLPPLAAGALVALGFYPSLRAALGGAPDHCLDAGPHAPHLCWLHPLGGAADGLHDVGAIGVLALLAAIALWQTFHWGQALGRLRLLEAATLPGREAAVRARLAASGGTWPGGLRVVGLDAPLCFVTGVRRPRLFVSTALVDALTDAELRAMVAHEAAHVARQDNAWRLLGQAALLAHLPGLGRRTFRRWAEAAEGACDEAAATATGARVVLAEALVKYQRLANRRPAAPAHGVAFGGCGALEARIRTLLDPAAKGRLDALRAAWPWLLSAALLWQAEAVHDGLEGLLHLVHG